MHKMDLALNSRVNWNFGRLNNLVENKTENDTRSIFKQSKVGLNSEFSF